jgi:TonB family protein
LDFGPVLFRRPCARDDVQLNLPKDVQVAQTSGFSRLDDAAKQAVRRWRFEAATDGSRPISVWTQVAITFKLTNG